MEPPFRFRVLEKGMSFAWNKKGVCTYCARLLRVDGEVTHAAVRVSHPGRRSADLSQ